MCLIECQKHMAKAFSRRNFMKLSGIAGAAAVASSASASAKVLSDDTPMKLNFKQVVDLTHKLPENFPTYFGTQLLEIETLNTFSKDGFNMKKWTLTEHVGTHMDAPLHFSNGLSADEIEPNNLVGPLAVVDIRGKVDKSYDAQLTPDDIKKWEKQNGTLPKGAIVAMQSGWAKYVNSKKFRNVDSKKKLHFPGFHIESANLLLERDVKGIFVDTLSLDYGLSPDFAVHYKWLPANRWGMECVANLDKLPAKGATVVVGAPAIAGATGGPSRVLALV